jgi:predicted Zn-dependent peptidase
LDLARLAKKVFTPENMVVTMMLPADASGPTEAQIKELAGKLKLAVAEDALEAAAAFEPFKLSNGVRVLAMRDATLPLVTVRASFLGGLLFEPQGQEGIANLMAKVWAKATESMDSETFAKTVEDLGAYVESQSGRNSMTIFGSFMSSNWLEGLDLLTAALTSPAFAPDNIEEARQEVLAWIKINEEHLSERVFKLMRKILFRTHPYRGDALGLQETVSAITRDDLKAYYQTKIRPDNVVIAIAGDIEPKAAVEALEKRLGSWKGTPGDPVGPIPGPPAPLTEKAEASSVADSAQVHLAVSFQTPGLGHPDQAPLEVLSGHLNGLGGVMFNELRNKRSLAYAVGAGFNPGLEVGAFTFYIASDTQKTRDALTGMLGIIDDIRAKPIDPEAVTGAIRYVSGIRKISRQTLDSRSDEAVFSELYGLGLDYDKKYLEALSKVTAEDVMRVADKYLAPSSMAVSVVGPQTAVDEVDAIVEAPAK